MSEAPSTPAPTEELPIIKISQDGKVYKQILKAGTGPKPLRRQNVTVNYVGTLTDGTEFDRSTPEKPFRFTVGKGVITGWSLALQTMKVGEIARVTIGSDYAYGPAGAPPDIPPNATLVFEIELLKVTK